mgnify:CR=1 FL=1
MDKSTIRAAGMAAILAGLAAAAVAETPPADFRGRQFVDSHGCVFQRATLSGRVMWLPLIDAAALARLTERVAASNRGKFREAESPGGFRGVQELDGIGHGWLPRCWTRIMRVAPGAEPTSACSGHTDGRRRHLFHPISSMA